MNDKKNRTLNLHHTKPITTKCFFFIENSQHQWAFVGGPMTSFNKSKMADGATLHFVKR